MATVLTLTFLVCVISYAIFMQVPWLLNKLLIVAAVVVVIGATLADSASSLYLRGACATLLIFSVLKLLHYLKRDNSNNS